MTVTELLEFIRRVELRTNLLVNNMMVGAYLSHFNGAKVGRGTPCAPSLRAANTILQRGI